MYVQLHSIIVAAIFSSALIWPLSAQRVQQTTIASSDLEGALAQGFTRIAGIRELRDGRVVLLDADDRLVYIVSADLSEARQVGRSGDGPGEYRMPSRLLALRGDTTAVFDTHNGRFLTITPSGEPGDILDLRYDSSSRRGPPPIASDLDNHLYARTSPVRTLADGSLEVVDSATILRWTIGSRSDTAAFIADDPSRYQVNGGFVRSSPVAPFAPRPAWAVGAAGRVAVVYPDPYHIMLIARDRSATEGPTIPYDRMRVTEEHKQTHRAEAERPRPMMTGRINDPQAASVTMVRRPFREPSGWAEFLPPFVANAEILFDPDGNLWVERTTASPADAQYDVIGRDGTLRHQVLLPAGTRLLGFGRNALYLVRRDDLDLEYLERYSHSGFSP